VERQLAQIDARFAKDPNYYVAAASCMWDPTPWFKTSPALYNNDNFPSLWKLQPENFRKLLHEVKKRMDALPKDTLASRFLMLDNWNEWAEGHYILPCVEFGFGYLQAVREELTARDNLPDYRLPQQIGTSGLNSYWAEPDFSAYPPLSCE